MSESKAAKKPNPALMKPLQAAGEFDPTYLHLVKKEAL
jgi:hypothetical protein